MESDKDEAETKTDAIAAVGDSAAASVDADSSSIVMETFAAVSSASSAAVKLSAAPYVKPVVPMGGWSSKDKERATGAASRLSNFKAFPLAGAGGDEGANCKFTPQLPINLSHTNYETLQALLDPATPEFTITFDQVVHLYQLS